MTITSKRSRPGYVDTILDLVTQYGDARALLNGALDDAHAAEQTARATRILGDIASALVSRAIPDPELDALLAVFDYGPHALATYDGADLVSATSALSRAAEAVTR